MEKKGYVISMEDWEKEAFDFASKVHQGDKDDAGRPYMEAHILPVVAILKQITKDKEIITAAYLHDTIEDGDTTYDEIKGKFGRNIAEIVKEVTKLGPSKYDYFPNLKSKKAIILKFADRLQNLSRMEPAWNEARQQRYMNRSKFWKDERDLDTFSVEELREMLFFFVREMDEK